MVITGRKHPIPIEQAANRVRQSRPFAISGVCLRSDMTKETGPNVILALAWMRGFVSFVRISRWKVMLANDVQDCASYQLSQIDLAPIHAVPGEGGS